MSGMFRLGDLDDWSPLGLGSVMDFGVPDDGGKVSIRLLAGTAVNVFVTPTDTGTKQLAATGTGNLRVRFTARAPFELSAEPQDATATEIEVWVASRREAQVIPEDTAVSYTTLEPRGIQPHDNVRRMMHIMEINNQRREQTLRAELARLGAQLAARPAGEAPAMATPPAAAPTPTPPAGDPPAAT